MTIEWNEEKEAALQKLKDERRQNQKRLYAEKTKEQAKIRRERWREKMKASTHAVGFLMEKSIYQFAEAEGVAVGKIVKEISEAVGIFAIQNGMTFSEAVAEIAARILPTVSDESRNPPAENPQIDPSVFDALSN